MGRVGTGDRGRAGHAGAEGPAGRSPRAAVWSTALAWISGAVATVWILWGPYLLFAYRNASARLVTETVVLCVALLAGYLAHGRFLRARQLQELLLAQGLIVLALASTPISAVIAARFPGEPGGADVWLSVALQLVGSLLLLLAALVGPVRVLSRATIRSARWLTPAVPALVLAALTLLPALGGDALPGAVDAAYVRAELRPDLLTAHPALVAGQLLSALCLLGASSIWALRRAGRDDTLVSWLAPACALGGFARLLFALTPSLYTDWFYAGDLLRLGMYVVLLVGSGRELAHYWSARTASAVLADRRRLAGELHDGVVQELVYIRGESHRVDASAEVRDRLINATDRALDEARAAIHALTRLDGEPLVTMLERSARELGSRHEIEVEVVAAEPVDVDPDQVHSLLRIVREAVTNAARHGHARAVRITLEAGAGQRVLRITDDGRGFDTGEAAGGATGYGLVSMSERASALPGTLVVDSAVGRGSEVTVTW